MSEKSPDKSPESSAGAAPAAGGLLRRAVAWAGAHRLKAGILLTGLVTSLGAVVGTWLYVTSNYTPPEPVTLARALAALDAGEDAEAYALAKRLQEEGTLPFAQRGGPALIYGAVAVREAEHAEGTQRSDFYLLASRFLQQARDLGFPADREGQGWYLLGESLFQCGQWEAAREALAEAVEIYPPQAARMQYLLAAAILKSPTPDLAGALQHNDAFLADTHLSPEQQSEGLLQRARILADLQRDAECAQTLDRLEQLGQPLAAATILRGRLLLEEARRALGQLGGQPPVADDEQPAPGETPAQDPDTAHGDSTHETPPAGTPDVAGGEPSPAASPSRENPAALPPIAESAPLEAAAQARIPAEAQAKFLEAIETLRRAIAQETLASQVTPEALYLIGECYLAMGRVRDAVDQFERVRRLFPDSPEAAATLLEEAEVGRRLGRADAMLARYREALGKVDAPEQYHNPWITLDDVRRRLTAAYETFLKSGDTATALAVIDLSTRLFPPERITQLKAETHQRAGENLVAQSATAPESEADKLLREGRKEFRRAGVEWERLAQLVFAERAYPEMLWNAAQCDIAGRDYQGAIPVLEEYLRDRTGQRGALALVALAQCFLARAQYEKALSQCLQCIEFYPLDAAAFQARLLASDAYVELGQPDRAQAMLEENLNGDYLSPASSEWRKSLFALGRLYHAAGRSEEAIRRLDEAVRRYPEAPESLEARYLLADAYRSSARQLQEQTESSPVQATRAARMRRIRELQTAAYERFDEVRKELSRQQEERPLGHLETAILRNAYFALASLQAQWEQYPKAIEFYLAVANRFQSEPEALEAYLQIAAAYRRMGELQKVRGVAEMAQGVLGRLPEDAPFTENTNRGRAQWASLFQSLAELK